jgi:DNA-binding MarR family transcriptional regulator
MTAPSFDAVIHAPARLQACAILSSAEEVEFALLRDALEVSDSVLSKHLKQLEEAGYVKARKANSGGRQRTWLALTGDGRNAFRAHVKALEQLAASVLPASVAAAE